MYTLANNISKLNMKPNTLVVVQILAFQDFYIKPRLLINMHDITTKNNRDHLHALCAKYDMISINGS